MIRLTDLHRRRLALAARWLLVVEGVWWAAVAVALAVAPERWAGSSTVAWPLVVTLVVVAVGFVAAGVGVGREPARMTWLALALAAGAMISSLSDQAGPADLVSFAVNLVLTGVLVLLVLDRARRRTRRTAPAPADPR